MCVAHTEHVLAQSTRDKFFYEMTRTNERCVLAQNTNNKFQHVLPQITRGEKFYEKTRTNKRYVLAQFTKNKEKLTNLFYGRTIDRFLSM
jgi:hypothetical protein